MPKGKTSNKSKGKKSVQAGDVEEPPGATAWGAWFRPTPSPPRSPPLMNPSNDSQAPLTEVPETQNPHGGNEAIEDAITQDEVSRKRSRGPNKVLPTPTNPNDRVLITTLHDEKFIDHKIVRAITKCIQLNFNDAWPTWKKTPNDIKEYMWAKFQEQFKWPIEKTNVVKQIWDTTCKERFKGMMEEERSRAKKHFGVSDIAHCKGYNEGWIRADIWDRLIDNVWNTEKWKNQSQKTKQNRHTEKNGSITKHTGGSIPFLLHAERMATQLNRKPTYGEVFNRTHKRDKGRGDFVDNKSKSVSESYTSSMSQKYGGDESSHPEFDRQAWCEAIGGIETTCTHVYGFGTTPRGKNLISPPISIGEGSHSSACSPLFEASCSSTEVDNLREEVADVKSQLQMMRESQNEIKTFLARMTEMFNPATIARNAGFSQIGPTDEDCQEKTTNSEE